MTAECNVSCLTGLSLVTELTTDQIMKYFPNARIVMSAGQYADARRKNAVVILDKGNFRLVRMIGPCPNFPMDDGVCKRGPDCFSKHISSV